MRRRLGGDTPGVDIVLVDIVCADIASVTAGMNMFCSSAAPV
jgi:hypothetical protein